MPLGRGPSLPSNPEESDDIDEPDSSPPSDDERISEPPSSPPDSDDEPEDSPPPTDDEDEPSSPPESVIAGCFDDADNLSLPSMDSDDLRKFMGDDNDEDLLPEFAEDFDGDGYAYGM